MNIHIYSEENLLKQLESLRMELGFYKVRFYAENGVFVDKEGGELEEFFLYPNGGTLRDKHFNIVTYLPKFDTSRGFVPPNA